MIKNVKILIIYTGGTIGMMHTPKGYVPDPGFPEKIMSDLNKINSCEFPKIYITAMNPLLDSSNMTPFDWNKIANVIKSSLSDYDGFVILHGTDTMAYTASALSFMIENQNKPIILTGSQIPYCNVRSDAMENLITSLIVCTKLSQSPIMPEVAICFDNKLLRGCRAKKVDAVHFNAFDSPNYPHLAEIEINFELMHEIEVYIRFNNDAVKHYEDNYAENKMQNIHLLSRPLKGIEFDVGILRLFPGITAGFVHHILQPPLKGLVLETYGVGNGPTKEMAPELFNAIRSAAVDRNIVIVSVTQCLRGKVIAGNYETSLENAGVVSCFDMTVEAALTKMYYLFYTGLNPYDVRSQMQINLRGELTKK